VLPPLEEAEDDYNSRGFLRLFFTDETSISKQIGGEEQLFTQKRFHHGPHRCFLDLELRSKLPAMMNYYLLSAVSMDKEKVVYYSRCWIEHKQLRKRYVLLAVFRSKCLHIRYEFVLCDPDDGYSISMLCGVSKMSPFVFLPDIPVDHAAAKEALSRYVCDPNNKLALIPGRPDKDEYGHFIEDGFDPIANALDGASSGKRTRIARNLSDGGTGASTVPKAKKGKPKPKPKPKAKKPRKEAEEVSAIIAVYTSHLHACCCVLLLGH
jgi:hypothetical protein